MLLTTTIDIKLRKDNIEYYHDKGYTGNLKDIITISVYDLPEQSERLVTYKCDYPGCNEVITLSYASYIKKRKRVYSGLGDFCNTHSKVVRSQWMQENDAEGYQKEKTQRLQKMKQTCLEKYGVDNAMQSQEVISQFKNNFSNKYGVDNPMQVQEFKERNMESMVKNYPVLIEYNNFYKIHGIPCSKNQKYISDLYQGKLNVLVSGFYLDILLPNNIYFEYNGQGHKLSVAMHRCTEEEFLIKEIQRYNILKQHGYKQIVFVSEHHKKLPSDDILLFILKVSEEYLLASSNNHWIEFNYDLNYIRIKDRNIPFNFDKPIEIKNII